MKRPPFVADTSEVISRTRSERGAVLVESAIIVPLIALLLFGIVEYGLAFKNASGYSASTRAGARAGTAAARNSTYQDVVRRSVEAAMGNVSDSSPKLLVVYKANPATGDPATWSQPGDYTTCQDCWIYRWDATRAVNEKWVLQNAGGNTWLAAEQSACGDVATDILGVRVEGRHNFVTGFFGAGVDLRERTVMRLEPQPSTGTSTCRP